MTTSAASRELFARKENNGVTGFVAATGESYLCPDTVSDPLYLEGAEGARSSLTVPLIYHGTVIGTLNVESPQPDAFDDRDRQTEDQRVQRCQRYQSSSVPLTGPRSRSASAFCSWAAAGVMRTEAKPVKRNCLRRTPTSPLDRVAKLREAPATLRPGGWRRFGSGTQER